jgi:O-antigen/teichoic acid export membrane protein
VRTLPEDPSVSWREAQPSRTVALNASSRWFTITVELALGFLMLPFNTRYLGAEDYGLWMLAASIVVYFPVLNLGYAGAMDRFVAHYRAQRDAQAISEVASTLFFVFALTGAIGFGIVTLVSVYVGTLFSISTEQISAGRAVMLLVGFQFALGLPIAVFGSVVNGFQRTYLNSIVGAVVALAVALVNVVVLMSGGDLVQLVAATTATRVLGFIAYRRNAHRVFPLLRVRYALFRRARLRELTGFSVYVFMQTLSNRLNYASDPIVIGAFVSTGAVAIWTIAQRLSDMVLQITNQLNDVLFPVSFLDIGSGSGLFSLAARRLGARVRSFDYDPQSVACTAELRRRYFPDDAEAGRSGRARCSTKASSPASAPSTSSTRGACCTTPGRCGARSTWPSAP